MEKDERILCFDAIFNSKCKVLILGSMPSVVSLKESFYYMHPTNRFWRVMSTLLKKDIPESIEEKKELMISNNIALWDVVNSCERKGSLDSNIKNVVVNDLYRIPKVKEMKIFTNGQTAYKHFKKHFPELECHCLPSTSSANNKI